MWSAKLLKFYIFAPYTYSIKNQFFELASFISDSGPRFNCVQVKYILHIPEELTLFYNYHSTSSVKVGSSEYKPRMILALEPPQEFEEPVFGQIQEIYIIEGKLYFYVCILETVEYSDHYCAFITKVTESHSTISHLQLPTFLPLTCHKLISYPRHICVVPKFMIR